MDLHKLQQRSETEFVIPKRGAMRVPGILYATANLVLDMDDKVAEQVANVAALPGIVRASYAMPDAHWGYGFPIGGVAAFDPDEGGVISAGGVGFDISCGVRMLRTELELAQVEKHKKLLADQLFQHIPAGVGSTGKLRLDREEMDRMLQGGARWAISRGYGREEDLDRTEEHGCMAGAEPKQVSSEAKQRQQDEVGTLGSGNHYLEVQRVEKVYDSQIASVFGLRENDVVISIHCGSRGLGHQIGTDFLKRMFLDAKQRGLHLPERELACAPIRSDLGREYLGAMRSAMNCAMANRQVLTHLTRETLSGIFGEVRLPLLYDVSHNTCKEETHSVDGVRRKLFVHRKGATRAFGPGHPDVPAVFASVGQPVLIGGSMGTASYVLAGTSTGESLSFGSACHGAGRAMSRNEATKRWNGKNVVMDLERRGILIRSPSLRGVAEEAPGAYKNVGEVCEAAERAGIARRVARVVPLVCVKG
ncbi:MAG: RtcB family protein [Planctomycetes bacterium]|nr:RtcB family protein [Planctomycetota bacterium]